MNGLLQIGVLLHRRSLTPGWAAPELRNAPGAVDAHRQRLPLPHLHQPLKRPRVHQRWVVRQLSLYQKEKFVHYFMVEWSLVLER